MSETYKSYKQGLIEMSDFNDAGDRHITVMLRDKVSGEIVGSKVIKRAALAKAFEPLSATPVVGSYHGKFVMEME